MSRRFHTAPVACLLALALVAGTRAQGFNFNMMGGNMMNGHMTGMDNAAMMKNMKDMFHSGGGIPQGFGQQTTSQQYQFKFSYSTRSSGSGTTLTIHYTVLLNGKVKDEGSKEFHLKAGADSQADIQKVFNSFRQQITSEFSNSESQGTAVSGGPTTNAYTFKFSYSISSAGHRYKLKIRYMVYNNGKLVSQKTKNFFLKSNDQASIDQVFNKFRTELISSYGGSSVGVNVHTVTNTYQLKFENTISWKNGKGLLVIVYTLSRNGVVIASRTKSFTLKNPGNQGEVMRIFTEYRKTVEAQYQNFNQMTQVPQVNYVIKFSYSIKKVGGGFSMTVTYKVFKNNNMVKTSSKTFTLKFGTPAEIMRIIAIYRTQIVNILQQSNVISTDNTQMETTQENNVINSSDKVTFKFTYRTVWKNGKGELVITVYVFKNGQVFKVLNREFPLTDNNPIRIMEIFNNFKNIFTGSDPIYKEHPKPANKVVFKIIFSYKTVWVNNQGSMFLVYRVYRNGKLITKKTKKITLTTHNVDEIKNIFIKFKQVTIHFIQVNYINKPGAQQPTGDKETETEEVEDEDEDEATEEEEYYEEETITEDEEYDTTETHEEEEKPTEPTKPTEPEKPEPEKPEPVKPEPEKPEPVKPEPEKPKEPEPPKEVTETHTNQGYSETFKHVVKYENGKWLLVVHYTRTKGGKVVMEETKPFLLSSNNPDEAKKAFINYKLTVTIMNVNNILQVPEAGFFEHFFSKVLPNNGNFIIAVTRKVFFNGKVIKESTKKFPITTMPNANTIPTVINKYRETFIVQNTKSVQEQIAGDGYFEIFRYTTSFKNGKGTINFYYAMVQNGLVKKTFTKTFQLKTVSIEEINEMFKEFKQSSSPKKNGVDKDLIPHTGYYEKFTYSTTVEGGKTVVNVFYTLYKDGKPIKNDKKSFPFTSFNQILVFFIKYQQSTTINKKEEPVTVPQKGFFQHFYYVTSFAGGKGVITITYKAFFNGKIIKTESKQFHVNSPDQKEITRVINEYRIVIQRQVPSDFGITFAQNGFVEEFSYFVYNNGGKRLIDFFYRKYVNGKQVDMKKQTHPLNTYTMEEINNIFDTFKHQYSSGGPISGKEIIPKTGFYSYFTFSSKWEGNTLKLFCFFKGYRNGVAVLTKSQTFTVTKTTDYTQALNFFQQFRVQWTVEMQKIKAKYEEPKEVTETNQNQGFTEKFTYNVKYQNGKWVMIVIYKRTSPDGKVVNENKTFTLTSNNPDEIKKVFNQYKLTITIMNVNNIIKVPTTGYFEHFYYTVTKSNGKFIVTVTRKVFFNGKVTKENTKKFTVNSADQNQITTIINNYRKTFEIMNTKSVREQIAGNGFVEIFTYTTSFVNGKGFIAFTYKYMENGKEVRHMERKFPLKTVSIDEINFMFNELKQSLSPKKKDVNNDMIPHTGYYEKFTYTTSIVGGKSVVTIFYTLFKDGKPVKNEKKTFPCGSFSQITTIFTNWETTVTIHKKQETVTIPQKGFFQHFYYVTSFTGGKGVITITYKAFMDGRNFQTESKQYPLNSPDQSEITRIINEYRVIIERKVPPFFGITFARNGFVEEFDYFVYVKDGKRLIDLWYRKYVNGKQVDVKEQTHFLNTYTMGEINTVFDRFKVQFSSAKAGWRTEMIPKNGFYSYFTFSAKWEGNTLKLFCFFKGYKNGVAVMTKTQTFTVTSTAYYTQALNFFQQFRGQWTAEMKKMESKSGQTSFVVSGGSTHINKNGQEQFIVRGGSKVVNKNGQESFTMSGGGHASGSSSFGSSGFSMGSSCMGFGRSGCHFYGRRH